MRFSRRRNSTDDWDWADEANGLLSLSGDETLFPLFGQACRIETSTKANQEFRDTLFDASDHPRLQILIIFRKRNNTACQRPSDESCEIR